MNYPTPDNETDRLAALVSYAVSGTAPEAAYDEIAGLAAQIAAAPVGVISVIDRDQAFVKGQQGLPPEITHVPRGAVCCSHAICRSDILIVPNLSQDERFKDLPMIGTEPFFKFYAGMPMITSAGYALGSLCVMDFEPRQLAFEQIEALRRLSRQAVAQLELHRQLIENEAARRRLSEQKDRVEGLILNILPADIAAELQSTGRVEPKHHTSVTILFADFVNFSRMAENMQPRALIDDLDGYFRAFDDLIERRGLEKLKTIGDAYMCVGGVPKPSTRHALDACLAAIDMQAYMARSNAERTRLRLPPWQIRVGVHTGSVMAGVVGKHKYTYDIWGDAVNVAARMQSAGEPGRVNVSDATFHHVKSYFDGTARGSITVKNRGDLAMYFIDRLKPAYARDPDGHVPNDEALDAAVNRSGRTWALPT